MILKVKGQKKETKDTFSLILEKPENFNFYPGQYLDVFTKNKESRILSISSSPSEDFIMLTYKRGFSSFKKALREIKSGDTISSSHPAGTVVLDNSSPAICLSGGIGIAPHRSMIKWALDCNLNLPITLIYSNPDPDFIFKKELDKWQKDYPGLTVHYIVTSKERRLNEKTFRTLNSKFFILNSIYYLAGPPAMVDDFEIMLLKLGVDPTNIRTDRFDGY